FNRAGIVILPVDIERETRDYETNNGGRAMMTHHKFRWRIYCRTGDYIEVTTFGEARDSGDKGANKAQTAAYKYAVIAALSLAEGHDDPDDERPEDRAGTVQRESAQQARDREAGESAIRKALDEWKPVGAALTDAEKAQFRDFCEREGM